MHTACHLGLGLVLYQVYEPQLGSITALYVIEVPVKSVMDANKFNDLFHPGKGFSRG